MELAHRLVNSRKATTFAAALSALLAVLLVLTYVNRYRARVDTGATVVSVLVAKHAIPKGTSGDVILARGLFETQRLRHDEALDGAVVNPDALRGRIATEDVYGGEQLTTAEFAASSSALSTQLSGADRAVSIPLDKAHGLLGEIEAGDHVDVIAAFNMVGDVGITRAVVKVALQDVPVLAITKPSDAAASSNVVLRVNEAQAAKLAFTSENGKLWLVLRPRTGAPAASPSLVTVASVLGINALGTGAR